MKPLSQTLINHLCGTRQSGLCQDSQATGRALVTRGLATEFPNLNCVKLTAAGVKLAESLRGPEFWAAHGIPYPATYEEALQSPYNRAWAAGLDRLTETRNLDVRYNNDPSQPTIREIFTSMTAPAPETP